MRRRSMVTWPEPLVESIARRRCVLFLGSGVSANSKNDAGKHPATWEAFLRDILIKRSSKLNDHKSVIEKLLDEKDYLMACEVIVDIIGEDDFGELAADEFRRPRYKPCDIHREIYLLDSRLVITPNIDKIYEQYAMNESDSSIVSKSYYEEDIAKYLRTTDYLIIRAHGYVDNTTNIIFTHRQYSLARCKYSAFYRLLDALILTHTFIFLGCGISDPDIQLTLENSNFIYPGCRPHYFVTAKGTYEEEISDVLFKNRNLELLTYSNPDGSHIKLLDSLKELNQKVEEKRKIIMDNQIW